MKTTGLLVGILLVLNSTLALGQRKLGVRPTESGGPLKPEEAAYDVTFYELKLSVNPADSSIQGSLTVHAKIVHPIDVFVLDLDSLLTVGRVDLLQENGEPSSLPFEHKNGQIWSRLGGTKQPGEKVTVRVEYGGRPRIAPRPPWVGGFVWSKTEAGQPWIATACQTDGADIWWPCKDHPSDEPDSMAIRVTVPEPLVVASNGRLRSVVENADHTRTYNWFVSTPINNYGVALNIAPYRTIEGSYVSVAGDTIPVTFWVLPENYDKGVELFPQFSEHLRFYERLLGPYPFRADKYGVAETPHLGMEHQTIIAYGNRYRGGPYGYDWLHHHELGHEWWGNVITASDWRDMWIHEGFCSYMQALYAEELHGMETYHKAMAATRRRIRNKQPVAPRGSRTSVEIYYLAPDYVESDGDMYSKGSWILHTLRYLIGKETLLKALHKMVYPTPELERATDGRQCRFVGTDDFITLVNRLTGRDLSWFFEVYLRQPKLPRLVSERHGKRLSLRWQVPGDLPFPMPVEVKLGDRVRKVEMPGGHAEIEVPKKVEPVLDPQMWILKANDSKEMKYFQEPNGKKTTKR